MALPWPRPSRLAPLTHLADIYFHQRNTREHAAALALRDAVLRLRRDGAFVAVPLFRVNTSPIGPHPAGSYEIWCPRESFAAVYSYLTLHRGDLSVLVHPLTQEARKDHDSRATWMGPPYRLDLDTLPVWEDNAQSQYHRLSTLLVCLLRALTLCRAGIFHRAASS